MLRKHLAIIVSVALVASGCATLTQEEVPNKPAPNIAASEKAAPSYGKKNIVDKEMFTTLPVDESDSLPDKTILPFSVSHVTVYEFLRTLLANTGVTLSKETEQQGPNGPILGKFMSASNVSGNLKPLLDKVSDSVGFFYSFSGGVLTVTKDRQFIAKIPSDNMLSDSLSNMLKTLGATDISVDKASSTVTYAVTKPVYAKVESYFNGLAKHNKQLAVKPPIAPLPVVAKPEKISQPANTAVVNEHPIPVADANADVNKVPAYVAPAIVSAPLPKPKETWVLNKTMTLKDNVDAWSKRAGWSPSLWEVTNYYEITAAPDHLEGSFSEALQQLADATGLNICAKKQSKYVRVTDPDISCKK